MSQRFREFEFMSNIDDAPYTMSVPAAAAKYFGLSRKAAYAAAKKGAIPTIKLGRTLRVPVKAVERMLAKAEEQVASK
jgi:excisionase family DNA binding protein